MLTFIYLLICEGKKLALLKILCLGQSPLCPFHAMKLTDAVLDIRFSMAKYSSVPLISYFDLPYLILIGKM